jgi:hypothetical protein
VPEEQAKATWPEWPILLALLLAVAMSWPLVLHLSPASRPIGPQPNAIEPLATQVPTDVQLHHGLLGTNDMDGSESASEEADFHRIRSRRWMGCCKT